MNNGDGSFTRLTNEEFKEMGSKHKDDIFFVGEVFKIKKGIFKVKAIGKGTMTLKLMPNGTPITGEILPAKGSVHA